MYSTPEMSGKVSGTGETNFTNGLMRSNEKKWNVCGAERVALQVAHAGEDDAIERLRLDRIGRARRRATSPSSDRRTRARLLREDRAGRARRADLVEMELRRCRPDCHGAGSIGSLKRNSNVVAGCSGVVTAGTILMTRGSA